ncbi:MAG TPA: hypothetical protein VFQ44_25915 [Streptosporangiaceae bacterium]|nr:hypothetical protein [Streptosporangiaceae bacterium]
MADSQGREGEAVGWKLEVIVGPVAGLDRAKAFYADAAGFAVDVDHRAGEDRGELTGRGAEVSHFCRFDTGRQVPGLDPSRAGFGSYFSFSDPDGNGWLVQEA